MDLIDRQAAIDAVMDEFKRIPTSAIRAKTRIKALPSAQPDVPDTNVGDTISRQAVYNVLDKMPVRGFKKDGETIHGLISLSQVNSAIIDLPSAQPERDIPIKPIETTDRAWGIPLRQAVCPKCDCYLGHIAFLDSYKGKRITYCETCGQAIDWEGWEFDE